MDKSWPINFINTNLKLMSQYYHATNLLTKLKLLITSSLLFLNLQLSHAIDFLIQYLGVTCADKESFEKSFLFAIYLFCFPKKNACSDLEFHHTHTHTHNCIQNFKLLCLSSQLNGKKSRHFITIQGLARKIFL